jgi:hypothetical protein
MAINRNTCVLFIHCLRYSYSSWKRHKLILRGCSMATSILHSQKFRFQITIYLIRNWDFFYHKHTYICALNQGAHTSFSKILFWKHIKMSLVLEYNWHKTSVFAKHKHKILTWVNKLKYSSWQLSFQIVQNVPVKSNFICKHTTLIPHDEINMARFNLWGMGCNTKSWR